MRRSSGGGIKIEVQIIFANLRSENEFGTMRRSGIETLRVFCQRAMRAKFVRWPSTWALFFRMMTGLYGKTIIQIPKSSVNVA